MRGWEAAMEAQLDLHRFWSSTTGARTAAAWKRSLGVGVADLAADDQGIDIYGRLHQIEMEKMHRAEPFYVTDDMVDLIEAAAETFKPEPLLPTDLLTEFGFVLLPKPHLGPDGTGRMVSFRAFGWMPVIESQNPFALGIDDGQQRHGVLLSFYSDVNDLAVEEAADQAAGLASSETGWRSRALDGMFGSRLVLLHAQPIWFNLTPEEIIGESVLVNFTAEQALASVDAWWRFVQVFLRFTMQYLSTRERHPLPRATRKRIDRAGLPPRDYVTVIELRRPRSKPTGETRTVNWTHQWIVHGFWRNQWYPSLGRHRQIYISDYVKGPEDRPLVIRKGRAFELVR